MSTPRRAQWQAVTIHPTDGGPPIPIPAWRLSVDGRTVLHAVSPSPIHEAVSAPDRRMIWEALTSGEAAFARALLDFYRSRGGNDNDDEATHRIDAALYHAANGDFDEAIDHLKP